MNPQLCQDIFTVSILIHVSCHLEINESDKSKEFVATIGQSYPFTIHFIYILGTDYNISHNNFGFSSEYPTTSDPLNVQTNGVTISSEIWNPPTPDVSKSPAEMLIGIYSAVLGFSNDSSIFQALIALGNVGNTHVIPLFGGVLTYNQGV